ncbi:MAG: hypothetical protein OEW02_13215 [Myxococcales bacterium]|nr:hypothetical protein [Myxococcales bacterium]MDH5567847.1 hypothetical protein [Myxococcales bacterium]
MKNLDSNVISKSCLRLLVVAMAATNLSLLVADTAQAAGALFQGQLTYYTNLPAPAEDYVITWPKTAMGNKVAWGNATVGNTAPAQKVRLPRSFVDFSTFYYCKGANCFDGYPVSGGFYEYVNGQANFMANEPNGALTTTTIRFRTTLWTADPTGHPIPYGSGQPVTPTTTFGGRYDFDRGGSVKLTPGPNKFSGSMGLLYGPTSFFYQEISKYLPVFFSAYGSFINPTEFDPTVIGEFTSSGMVTRFRLTGQIPLREGGVRSTTGGTAMNYVTAKAYYLHSIGNWMTGMIEGFQPLGIYSTTWTHTGYDSRTPAGLNGVISLMRPRITHTYLNYPTGGLLKKNYSAVNTWGLKVTLTPEPGAMLMLGAGILTLAGLIRLRRR